MLGHSSDTTDMVHIRYMESLNAGVVQDAPHLDHTFGVSSDKGIHLGETVNTDEGVLVPIQFQNHFFKVGVPHKHFKVEATTNNDLVLLGVRHLSDRFIVTLQDFDRLLRVFFSQLIW